MARLSYHHPEAPVFPRLSGLLSQVKYLSAHESLSFIPSTQASCYITIRRLLSFLFAESGVKKWIDYQVQFSQFKNHDRCPKFTHKGIFFLLRRVEGGAWHFQNRTRKDQLQNTSHSHTRKGAEFNFFVHFSFSVLPMSKAFGNFFLPDPNCWLGSAKLLAASNGISPIFLWTTFISCNCFYFIKNKIIII